VSREAAAGGEATRTIGVAVAIPEPYGSELQGWRRAFGDPLAEAIPTHVTVLPPTEVGTDDLPGIEEHLRRVAAAGRRFAIHLRGTGSFRPVSPVVFVQLAYGISDCERLERHVRAGPLARELTFPYHPHVTVAHDVAEEDLDRAFTALAAYEARFTVWGFSLYEHGPDGVWRPARDFSLGRDLPGPEPSPDDGG
jgi:2'-5' RNA ligase